MAALIGSRDVTPFGPRSALVHWQLPGCAGGAVKTILRSNFEHFWELHDDCGWHLLDDVNAAQGPVAVSGNVVWGIHEQLSDERDVYYVTWLRHPWNRIRSLYKYRSRRPMPMLPSFAEFILGPECEQNALVEQIGAGDLQLAQERLESVFHYVGIAEYFDVSVREFAQRYQLSLNGIASRNVSEVQTLDCPESLADYFLEANAADIELYEWAVARFMPPLGLPGDVPDEPPKIRTDRTSSQPLAVAIGQAETGEEETSLDQLNAALEAGDRRKAIHDALLALYREAEEIENFVALLRVALERFRGYTVQYLKRFHPYLHDGEVSVFVERELAVIERCDASSPDASPVRWGYVPLRLLGVSRSLRAGALGDALLTSQELYRRFPDNAEVLVTLCTVLLYVDAPAAVLEILGRNPAIRANLPLPLEMSLIKAAALVAVGRPGCAHRELEPLRKRGVELTRVLPSARWVPLTKAVTPGHRLLLVAPGAGGEMHARALLRDLQAVGSTADVVTHAHGATRLKKIHGVRTVFELPYDYVHAIDRIQVNERIFATDYDAVMVTGGFSQDLRECLALAREIRTSSRYLSPIELLDNAVIQGKLLRMERGTQVTARDRAAA